jgi:phosphonate C-P lyase system protein PhnG
MPDADITAAPRSAVLELASSLAAGRDIEHLQLPAEGLWLLQVTEPVRRDGYFIGEVPVGQACVRLRDSTYGEASGGAVLMHADRELAVAAAVCDAVARAGWPGADAVARLRAEGAALRHEAERARAAILSRTRVDFSELGQEE